MTALDSYIISQFTDASSGKSLVSIQMDEMRPKDVYVRMMADTLKVAHPDVEIVKFTPPEGQEASDSEKA